MSAYRPMVERMAAAFADAELWNKILEWAADELAADRLDDGEPERIRQKIADMLSSRS